MRDLRFTTSAEADLERIHDYGVETWGTEAARNFIADVRQRISILRHHPAMGRPRENLAPGLRSFVTNGYVWLYTADDSAVTILAVLHERQSEAALRLADRLSEL